MVKEYSFFPGCSGGHKASASNYMVSVASMCRTLGIRLNEIPDWNCCGASIGYAEGGGLPRTVLNARNMALSEAANPGQDIVARIAVKPTPTIAKDQRTIDKVTLENMELKAVTRRDPTIVPRVWPVAEAFMAIILLDYYMQHIAYQGMWRT